MMTSCYSKFSFFVLLMVSFWANHSQADSTFLKRYMREHNFMPENGIIDSIKPHEEDYGLSTFEDIFEKIENDTGLKMELEGILNGGPLDAGTDPGIWYYMRGGDIIGNGGGIVELKFNYHYDKLPNYIDDCLNSHGACVDDDSDAQELRKIRDIIKGKHKDHNRIIFLSGSEYPKFFEEPGSMWGARTAKTGFSPEVPLFVNSDHLYRNSVPALNDNDILSLLVHETGHQAKNRDHGYLTRLGNTLVNFLGQRAYEVEREYQGVEHKVQIINFASSRYAAEASFSYNGEQVDLKPMLFDSISCWHPDQRVVGYELSNPHWKRVTFKDRLERFPMGLWMTIHCQNPMQRTIYKREVDLNLTFLFSTGAIRHLQQVEVEVNKD